MLSFRARCAAGAAVLLALCAVSPRALAQSAARADELPPAGEYEPLPASATEDGPEMRIHLSPEARGLSYSVHPDDASRGEPERCDGSCTLYLHPGYYDFAVYDHGKLVDTQRVRVRNDAIWHVRRQDITKKWLGLGMGIGGGVAAFAGMILTMPIIMSAMCEDSNCVTDAERTRGDIGFGLMLGSAVMMPLGWHWFAANLKPIASIQDVGQQSWTDSLAVGIARTQGGARLSASFAF